MTDRDALIAAVAADPGDDLPRLVFADWLEEHGDPAQAAFIRGHVELTRMKPNDRRRQKLAEELRAAAVRYAAGWVAPLCEAFGQPAPEWPPDPAGGWLTRLTSRAAGTATAHLRPRWAGGGLPVPCTTRVGQNWGIAVPLCAAHYRRGLPGALSVFGRHVRDGAGYAAALRAAPVTDLALTLTDYAGEWPSRDGPWFARLRALTLRFVARQTTFGRAAGAFEPVFRSPHLTGLRALALKPAVNSEMPFESLIGDDTIAVLAASPLAGRVRILRVPLRAEVVRGLRGYPAASPLEELHLCPCEDGLTPDRWRELADLPVRPTLKRLCLAGCSLTQDALGALCRGPRWDGLVALRLDSNLFADGGGATLARLAPFPKLQALRLDRCGLADDAARALARSPLVRTLRALDLSHNRITADGALPLAVALAEGPLVRLRLGGNPISRRRRRRIRDILRDRVVLDP
jgi:uncharacterized protein (TIGR02996 family)